MYCRSFFAFKFIINVIKNTMLTTIAAVLIVLWLLGYLAFPVVGSFIHILLVIAIVLFLVRVIQGRNPVV